MEELIELTKKQLKIQKIISVSLVVLILILFIGGGLLVNQMNRMAAAMEDAVEQLEQIDIDSINGAIDEMKNVLESADEFSDAVDDITEKVQDFGSWFGGLLGN